jgi:toxin ParE1/3/4
MSATVSPAFPYGVLYTIEAEFILIVAVMHCSREPGYWKRRIGKRKKS